MGSDAKQIPNAMNVTVLKALAALLPAGMLLAGAAILCVRRKTVSSCLELLGALCLVLVVLTHVFEALQLFRVTFPESAQSHRQAFAPNR